MKKKTIIKSVALVFAVMLLAISCAFPVAQNSQVHAIRSPADRGAFVWDGSNVTSVEVPASQTPGDRVSYPVFAQGNQRLVAREIFSGFRVLSTADGKPVMNRVNSAVVMHDETTDSFIDGANKKLGIFLDSNVGGYRLQDGSMQVVAVPQLHETVYLLTYRNPQSLYNSIWATKKTVKLPWNILTNITGNNTTDEWYDMHGNRIPDQWITEHRKAPWYNIALTATAFLINPVLGITALNVITSVQKLSWVTILERTTFAQLLTEMSMATVHPWATIRDGNGVQLKTSDDKIVYINPNNGQLSNWLGYGLYNKNSGLPIVLHQGKIVTVDLREETVTNGVLVNAMSIEHLLMGNVEFFMNTIVTPFGTFQYPVFNMATGDDREKNPEWVLLNGENIDKVKLPNGTFFVRSTIGGQDGESFTEWLDRMFGSGGGWQSLFSSLKNIGMIIGIVILALIFLPVLIPLAILVVRIVFGIVTMPLKWLGKRLGV